MFYNLYVTKPIAGDFYFRRNSLRLRGFDYASSRSHFVTIVAENRKRVFTDLRIAAATIETLLEVHKKFGFNLYCYTLMPDHFHGLIGIGQTEMTLGRICGHFKSLSTRRFWEFGEGRLWQRQFFDHVIRNEVDFWETIEYIRENPVKKDLCKSWEDWEYYGEPDLQKFFE